MTEPRVAMITNIPSPYREETHVILNDKLDNNYRVYYCSMVEPNRLWKISDGNYNKTFLKKTIVKFKNKPIYLNLDIIKEMIDFNPDVIITAGFNPTMLLAFLWSKFRRKKHIAFTDGTLFSEERLSKIHKWVRKLVFRYTDAFIGASKKSLELYTSYSISDEKLFLSPLCVNNALYKQGSELPKKYDVIFSGQFIERKMPFFFIDVIKLANELITIKVILIGSGKLKEKMLNRLSELNIEYSYPGFIQQEHLPFIYGSAKILLFPTELDPWGVVANEALAVGLPVMTCENAGAANELIIHDFNGYVLPLDERIWAQHLINVLTDKTLYKKLSENALISVKEFNQINAVDGILCAINFVLE